MNDWSRAMESIDRICTGGDSGPDGYELLQQIYLGFPLVEVGTLVRSSDVHVVTIAASILPEAGTAVGQVHDLLDELLGHSDSKVRYYGVQAVLGAGSPGLARQTATSIALLHDPEQAVRRPTVRLLAYAPTDQLAAAAPLLDLETAASVMTLLASDY